MKVKSILKELCYFLIAWHRKSLFLCVPNPSHTIRSQRGLILEETPSQFISPIAFHFTLPYQKEHCLVLTYVDPVLFISSVNFFCFFYCFLFELFFLNPLIFLDFVSNYFSFSSEIPVQLFCNGHIQYVLTGKHLIPKKFPYSWSLRKTGKKREEGRFLAGCPIYLFKFASYTYLTEKYGINPE